MPANENQNQPENTNQPNPSAPKTLQVVLGLFIVWQIFFLVMANSVEFLQDIHSRVTKKPCVILDRLTPGWRTKRGHFWQTQQSLLAVKDFWGQLTGQEQTWQVFAPEVFKDTHLPAVALRWEKRVTFADALANLAAGNVLEQMVLLQSTPEQSREKVWLSPYEPKDIHHYFRFGDLRNQRTDFFVVVDLIPIEDESEQMGNKLWAKQIERFVRRNRKLIRGYLRWKTADILRKNKSLKPPAEVILLQRRYHLNPPYQDPPHREGPLVLPLVRWKLGDDAEKNSLEAFDPQSGTFSAVTQ